MVFVDVSADWLDAGARFHRRTFETATQERVLKAKAGRNDQVGVAQFSSVTGGELVIVTTGVFGKEIFHAGEITGDAQGEAIQWENSGKKVFLVFLRRAGDSAPYLPNGERK